jgi:hypothetical protein
VSITSIAHRLLGLAAEIQTATVRRRGRAVVNRDPFDFADDLVRPRIDEMDVVALRIGLDDSYLREG